jgi:hypothetical protein
VTADQAITVESFGCGDSSEGVDAAYRLEERFARLPRSARSLTLYYRLKPVIARRAQIALRRSMACRLRRRHSVEQRFPGGRSSRCWSSPGRLTYASD